MPRYSLSDEQIEERLEKLNRDRAKKQEEIELRKRRELMRRRVHAALYEPRTCMGDPVTGASCTLLAVAGATLCPQHGGTTKAMQQAARMRLLYLVEPALRVLNKSMASSDENIRLKAAQILLDRAGFHPHATLEITESKEDLSQLSDAQLKARAARLLKAMDSGQGGLVNDLPDSDVIDAEYHTEPKKDGSVH
jgi:hypothetical protein